MIGTPPNLILQDFVADEFPNAPQITFGKWFLLGYPMSIILTGVLWFYMRLRYLGAPSIGLLQKWSFQPVPLRFKSKGTSNPFIAKRAALGPMKAVRFNMYTICN